VFDILRSSFDLLPQTERSLFLDLLCYRPFVVEYKKEDEIRSRV
jgi:hypothetical protein